MNLEARDVSSTPDARQVWKKVVDGSPDAWHWHTWNTLQFTMSAATTLHPSDLSFFVYEVERVVGCVPLMVRDSAEGATDRVAAYHPGIGFLPWPACATENDHETFENFAFEELERRARSAGAACIRLRLTPPRNVGNEKERAEKLANTFGYTLSEISSHTMSLDADIFSRVRDRYQRYYRKFSPRFDVRIVEGAGVTKECAEQYAQLHEKDAGRRVRSPESYQRQADTARAGQGFYVVVMHEESKRPAGMLLISLYKDVAYDNSVAIDPEYAELRIGVILKWAAIEELLRRGVHLYDLGPRADLATANEKERGIIQFKEGWTRGQVRSVWQLEKLLL